MPLSKSTAYHAPPPPLLQFFLLLHLYLKVISVMRRPFHTIYVGYWSPPAPSSWPPNPPPSPTQLPPAVEVAPKREGVGPLSRPPRDLATRLTCGPILIKSPCVKRWGPLVIPLPPLKLLRPPTHRDSCSRLVYLSAISDFVPRLESMRTPKAATVMWPVGPLVRQF